MKRSTILLFLALFAVALVSVDAGTGGPTVGNAGGSTTPNSVIPAGFTSVETTVVSAPAASSVAVTAFTNRASILMVATQSFVFSVGTSTIPTGAAPVISAGMDVDAGVPISIQGANAATVAVTIYQFGR